MNLSAVIFVLIAIAAAVAGMYWFRARRAGHNAKVRGAWLADSRIEVAEIWSDEEMQRKDRELANAMLEKVGMDLCADESAEAADLRAFLVKIRHGHTDGERKTPRDIGVAWFACLQILDREPASELARVFSLLNDAWTATRGHVRVSDSDKQMTLKAITTRLVQSEVT